MLTNLYICYFQSKRCIDVLPSWQCHDAAIQSACFNALVYLQEVNVLIIGGIHSSELKHCRRELLQASSWAEAFEQHAAKLESKLSAMVEDKTTVLPVSQTQSEDNLIQETTGTKV